MKAVLLALPILLATCSIRAQQSQMDTDAVEYAKSIDVKTLDESLPSQRFEDWLRSGPPHVDSLQWSSEETCSNRPFGDEDFPRCVRVTFGRGGQGGFLAVLIGTMHKGIVGPPKLYWPIWVGEEIFVSTGQPLRLSDLPETLDQPAVVGEVHDFYKLVIARHPRGIPLGEDRDKLWPLLSARLGKQMDTARACQEDYVSQHTKGAAGPKPGWLTSGLFSGDGGRAAPESVMVVTKERQGDGSFLLVANATERTDRRKKNSIVVGGGIRAYAVIPGKEWQIAATVIRENNRWVIDDVRIFDGRSTKGSSRLLSESFSGCNGPHWTGQNVRKTTPVVPDAPSPVDWVAVNVLRGAAEDEEVTFAKSVDVHQLDAALPSMRLDAWLRTEFPRAKEVIWNGHKCNIKEGPDGATSLPNGGLCAGVGFKHGNARAGITVRKGISDSPTLERLSVQDKDAWLLEPLLGETEQPTDSDHLSDLHRFIREEAVIDVTRNLYAAVLDQHATGTPGDNGMRKLDRFLAHRLRARLAQAQSCQADFQHQSANSGVAQTPAWFTAEPFSGTRSQSEPVAFFVDSKVRNGDGSFQVKVWLSRKSSAASSTQWNQWFAMVSVKLEDGTFLVEDVRIFDGQSDAAPSHLLSGSFAGCNGARWVGSGSVAQ